MLYNVHKVKDETSIDELISFLKEVRKEQGDISVDMCDYEMGGSIEIRFGEIIDDGSGNKCLRLK